MSQPEIQVPLLLQFSDARYAALFRRHKGRQEMVHSGVLRRRWNLALRLTACGRPFFFTKDGFFKPRYVAPDAQKPLDKASSRIADEDKLLTKKELEVRQIQKLPFVLHDFRRCLPSLRGLRSSQNVLDTLPGDFSQAIKRGGATAPSFHDAGQRFCASWMDLGVSLDTSGSGILPNQRSMLLEPETPKFFCRQVR